jgi:hypothetical protein
VNKLFKIVVGIYMVVLVVAVPYFNWRYAQENGFVRWILFGEFVATVKGFAWPYFFATNFFSNESSLEAKNAPLPPYAQKEPYEVHCTEPLPPFTLGRNSNPTKAQVTALCACIWQNLGTWERETSEKFVRGKEAEVSWMYKRAFPSRFGSAIKKCGGMDM